MCAGTQLLAALLANAVKLSKAAAATLPPDWNVVQVEMAATNFSALSAAAAPSIHRFLQQSVPHVAQTAVGDASCFGQPDVHAAELCETNCKARQKGQIMAASSASRPQGTLQPVAESTSMLPVYEPPQQHAGNEVANASDTDLTAFSAADIRQQQQLFEQLEAQKRASVRQPVHAAGSKRTNPNQSLLPAGKAAKVGQRTIKSIFSKAPSR